MNSESPTDPDRPQPRKEDESRTSPLRAGAPPADDRTGSFHPQEHPAQAGGSPPCPAGHSVPADLVNHPRYTILEYLGSGGMGTVYKARHRLMDRLVALKIISLDLANRPAMIDRFRREVQAAARLTHPNIVHAYDAEQAGDTHFLVMEYVEGVDLDRVLQLRGRLPVARACDYARQVGLGLQHAWERGMVHRDIKPHNLMVTSREEVKILDFGLARFLREVGPEELAAPPVGESAAGEGSRPAEDATDPDGPVRLVKGTCYAYTGAGTADYIAPEEAAGSRHADIRADVYSLGCTLYRFLSGRVPFPEGDLVQKVHAHLKHEPEPLAALRAELPPRLCEVVARMMAKDPARRYQTPAEVAQALAPFTLTSPRPILIVDDDSATRTMVADVFERHGYPAAYAGNGQEALDRLREGLSPSLILLDLMMPVMDGWEFLQRQRQDPALAAIPVVIVSAAQAEQTQAIALGAVDYLNKPIGPEELTRRVSAHVPPP